MYDTVNFECTSHFLHSCQLKKGHTHTPHTSVGEFKLSTVHCEREEAGGNLESCDSHMIQPPCVVTLATVQTEPGGVHNVRALHTLTCSLHDMYVHVRSHDRSHDLLPHLRGALRIANIDLAPPPMTSSEWKCRMSTGTEAPT